MYVGGYVIVRIRSQNMFIDVDEWAITNLSNKIKLSFSYCEADTLRLKGFPIYSYKRLYFITIFSVKNPQLRKTSLLYSNRTLAYFDIKNINITALMLTITISSFRNIQNFNLDEITNLQELSLVG